MRFHHLILAAISLTAGPVAAEAPSAHPRHPAPAGHGSASPHSRQPTLTGPGRPSAELLHKLRDRKPNGKDAEHRLGRLPGSRDERRHERRRWLRTHWGAATRQPAAVAELSLHARRMARLSRLEELAGTDRSGEERQRLLEKIAALREREEQRHERAMQRFATAAPGAAGSGAPPAASVSGPAASARGAER